MVRATQPSAKPRPGPHYAQFCADRTGRRESAEKSFFSPQSCQRQRSRRFAPCAQGARARTRTRRLHQAASNFRDVKGAWTDGVASVLLDVSKDPHRRREHETRRCGQGRVHRRELSRERNGVRHAYASAEHAEQRAGSRRYTCRRGRRSVRGARTAERGARNEEQGARVCRTHGAKVRSANAAARYGARTTPIRTAEFGSPRM